MSGSIPAVLLIGLALLLLTFIKVLGIYQFPKTKTRNKKKKEESSMKINILIAVSETIWALAVSNSVGTLSA
ncbi:hypothetical protein [Arenicella sp. 4NH20-0111]|uniref:hypothetical protein n=1 Tax=Arenicella sp. 4NH20-0111 TaxID=3127648 RepID=UPI00334144CF